MNIIKGIMALALIEGAAVDRERGTQGASAHLVKCAAKTPWIFTEQPARSLRMAGNSFVNRSTSTKPLATVANLKGPE